MKLTKDQRYTLYCFMLEEAENPSMVYCAAFDNGVKSTSDGFCFMLYNLFDYEVYFTFEYAFPELYKLAKCPGGWYLWNNWDERKAALKKAIELTSDF